MSGWDIDPASVGSILESEKNTVDNELSPALSDTVTALNDAITATQDDAKLVASAVSEWWLARDTEITNLTTSVGNILNNTVNAVNAYIAHDEESALVFQQAAK
jgi:hypothetical protein